MRVIKHGDLYEIGQITCKRCNCEMAYTRQDIQEIEYTDYSEPDRETFTKKIITCPECHATIEV